jgi:hypothetical protein
VRAGRVRVLRERLPELRAETLLVFLFASKECEECASLGQPPPGLEEKKTTEGTHRRDPGRRTDERPSRRVKTHVRAR